MPSLRLIQIYDGPVAAFALHRYPVPHCATNVPAHLAFLVLSYLGRLPIFATLLLPPPIAQPLSVPLKTCLDSPTQTSEWCDSVLCRIEDIPVRLAPIN